MAATLDEPDGLAEWPRDAQALALCGRNGMRELRREIESRAGLDHTNPEPVRRGQFSKDELRAILATLRGVDPGAIPRSATIQQLRDDIDEHAHLETDPGSAPASQFRKDKMAYLAVALRDADAGGDSA